MKDTTTAIYNGKKYEATIREDGIITILSDNPCDEEKGFGLYTRGKHRKYIKRVHRDELEELFEIKKTAKYKGYNAQIFEEQGERILIMISNILDETSKELGMDRAYDKGMFLKWINKDEAEIIVEKKPL